MNPLDNPAAFFLIILGLCALGGLVYGTILYRKRPAHGFFPAPTVTPADVLSTPNEKKKRPGDPPNTLQQDLYLLTKGKYNLENDMAHDARLICAYHILMPSASMTIKDTLYWVFKEFLETGIILNDPKKMTHFFLNLGGHFHWLPLESASPQKEYQYNVLHGLLSELRMTQVYENGKLLMPFEIPEPDPKIIELLKTKVPTEA